MSLPIRRNIDVMLDLVEVAGKDVVDIGCGAGGLARRLARDGARVIGIECGDEALASAKAAAPTSTERYLHGFGQDIPLQDNSADLVIYANSLHHVPVDRMDDAIGEAARVLRAGGRLYIQEPLTDGSYFELMTPVDDETEIRTAAQRALAATADAGFRLEAETVYRIVQAFDDFDEFRAGLGAVDPARLPVLDAIRPEMEQRFRDLGRPSEGRMTFDQPMKVNLYIKAQRAS